MGLDIYQKVIIGFKVSDIVTIFKDSKEIPILDNWTQQPSGKTKTINKDFFKFNDSNYDKHDLIEKFTNEYNLNIEYTDCEGNLLDNFIGFNIDDKITEHIKSRGDTTSFITINDISFIDSKINELKILFKTNFNIDVEPKLTFFNYYSY